MIYVAASSAEIDRAEKWIHALRSEGIQVTSTWPDNIRRVQAERAFKTTSEAGNPAQATVEDRRGWARTNVEQISAANMFWLLVPSPDHPSQGAFFEFGYAVRAERPRLIASGGDQRFVFTALADDLFDDDESAFKSICRLWRSVP